MSSLVSKGLRRLRRDGLLRTLRYGLVNWAAFKVVTALIPFLPRYPLFDRAIAKFDFWVFQWRWPTKAMTFNDAFHRVRATDEILNPLRVFCTDKEFVKLYVRAMVGERYNVPTLAVLHSLEEARAYAFPADCCIKPTHGSGQVLFRRGGSPVDFDELAKWFTTNYYRDGRREENYRALRPKVIVEPLLFGSDNVRDFKFFCVRGVPKMIVVDVDRHGEHLVRFFDPQWRALPFTIQFPMYPGEIGRPANFDEMLRVAATLSSHFDLVRIDLYTDGERCYLGEVTNCHANATYRFLPASGEAIAAQLMFGDGDPLSVEMLGHEVGVGGPRAPGPSEKLDRVA